MAELVISKLAEAVVSQAIERITELLFHEATFLIGFEGEVEQLQKELRRMNCFLKDADRKQDQDERVRNWIAEVKDVANRVEDVIEVFITKVSSSYIKVFHMRRLKKEINSIQAKINDISKSTQTYRIEFTSGEGTSSTAKLQRELRRSHPDDEDDDIISLKDSVKALKAELMKPEDQLCIVSIVGMGGLGKTTLAKKVYNHSDVKQHFDCRAWAYISQQYVLGDVLYQILYQLDTDIGQREKLRGLKEHHLAEEVKDKLKHRRYLVVLDDIWEIKAWDGIKNAFPKGQCGSKVVFTTRNRKVASSADPSSLPIEPPFLTFDESWELLQRKAFRRDAFGKDAMPTDFERLGRDMLGKCGGLPLAIVILGGLLRTRDSINEWEEVQRDLNANLNKIHSGQEYEGVHGILALSYNDLPYYLKPCFLYLGSFPEDREIPKRILIQLWIAEGFIEKMRQPRDQAKATLEEVAEQYLGELMDRCMIQVARRNSSKIGVKAYRIHDLMRDLCLSKSRDEDFLELVQNHHMDTISSRRIAIHDGRIQLDRYQAKTHLRSILYLTEDGFPCMPYLKGESFLLLRVLKISIHSSSELRKFKSISVLFHLRYLGLLIRIFEEEIYLPNSIGKLRNLRTLRLQCQGSKCILPKKTSQLTHLTHLLIGNLGFKVKYSFPSLSRGWLPILPGIEIRYNSLVKLINLQFLKLEIPNKDCARAILESPVIRSGSLRSLELNCYKIFEDFPSLHAVSHCKSLYRLRLWGAIEEQVVESSHHCLQYLPASLSKLILGYSHIKQDPMPVLEKLPNLRFLWLAKYAYRSSEMVCSARGFPKLESLHLSHLIFLKKWRVEKDAMPSLKRLGLAMLPLTRVPEGLRFVTTLAQLDISGMSEDFKERVKVSGAGIEGGDFYIVRHVRSILLST